MQQKGEQYSKFEIFHKTRNEAEFYTPLIINTWQNFLRKAAIFSRLRRATTSKNINVSSLEFGDKFKCADSIILKHKIARLRPKT